MATRLVLFAALSHLVPRNGNQLLGLSPRRAGSSDPNRRTRPPPQALLPVPPIAELPPRLRAVWGGSSDFSTRRWPCLFTVRALSACALVTLDAGAFAALLQEYEWVSVTGGSGKLRVPHSAPHLRHRV